MLLININTKFDVAVRVQQMLYSLQTATVELQMSGWQTLDNLWTLPMVYWFGFKLLKLASHTLLLPPHRIIKSTKSSDTFCRHLTNITLCQAQHRCALYPNCIVWSSSDPPQSSQLQPHCSGTREHDSYIRTVNNINTINTVFIVTLWTTMNNTVPLFSFSCWEMNLQCNVTFHSYIRSGFVWSNIEIFILHRSKLEALIKLDR